MVNLPRNGHEMKSSTFRTIFARSRSDVDDEIYAYIATAKNQGALNELLKQAEIMN